MNLRHLAILAINSIVLFLFTNNSFSQVPPIDLTLSSSQIIEYQPFSGKPAAQLLNVTMFIAPDFNQQDVDTATKPSKQVSLIVRPSRLGNFFAVNDNGKLPIGIRPTSKTGTFDLFNNEYRHNFSKTPVGGETLNFEYQVFINAGIYASPGSYRLPLYVGLLNTVTKEPLSDLVAYDVEVFVKPKLQVNIAGTRTQKGAASKTPMIDFGKLESGESQQVFIQLRGNAPANITISSENKGLMAGSSKDTFVDYSITVGKTASELEQPLNINRQVSANLKGSSYPMKIIVGDVRGAFSGTYRDRITVEVRPQ